MSFRKYTNKHYYNNLSFTLWPFLLSTSLFVVVYMIVFLFNKYYIVSSTSSFILLTIFLAIFLDSVMGWIADVREEAFCGKYTRKLKSALSFGFMLFLISEVMLFGSFFWVYFDRIFHLSYVTGYLTVPSSVELLLWYREPLYATLVLIASGYTCNYSYYLFIENDLLKAYFYSFLTNLLGCIFLYLQYMEYSHLNFTISETVYCAVFFLLTGFHGAHVLIGNLFLFVQYWYKYKEGNRSLLGLTLALVYWHFVDIIWIFLFVFVYMFNNLDYLVISDVLPTERSLELLDWDTDYQYIDTVSNVVPEDYKYDDFISKPKESDYILLPEDYNFEDFISKPKERSSK